MVLVTFEKVLFNIYKYEWFVKFNSSYQDADYVYIAMEYMPVGDISKTFVNDNRWNERDARVVIEQLLHGLAAMHREGITHRDLKPEVCTHLCFENCGESLIVFRIYFSTSQQVQPRPSM